MSGRTPADGLGTGSSLPLVYVLGTGGSISCIGDSRTDLIDYNYADRHLSIDEMVARIPEVSRVAEIHAEQFLNVYGGDVSTSKWLELSRRINQILREDSAAVGVVVTHGTSTLEETAYFLNLTVKSAKPVVVTGAMRPPTAMSTDADMNLYDAVRVAVNPDSVGKGVLVVLNNQILSARDAIKTSTSRLETFKSAELGFLGYADSDGSVAFYRSPTRAHTAETEFDPEKIDRLPRVDIAYAYSGVDGVAIEACVKAGCKGLVGAGLGSGSAPRAFHDALEAARKDGIVVVIASQSFNGRVMGKRAFKERGFIVADNLAPKKARILLMLGLAQNHHPEEIQRMLLKY